MITNAELAAFEARFGMGMFYPNDIRALFAEVKAMREPCVWTEMEDDQFAVGCHPGESWYLPPDLELYQFCPYCGHPIMEAL